MTEAYGTLATGGVHRQAVIITRIENKNGDVLFETADTSQRVLDEEVAGAVTTVLRGVFENSEGTAYGYGPSNGQVVAGKTGTGQEFRDHWLCGYSPSLVCSVWIGNRDYSSTSPNLKANDLWSNFMSKALEGTPTEQFPTVKEPKYKNTSEELSTNGYGYNYGYGTTGTNSAGAAGVETGVNGDGAGTYGYGTDGTGTYGYGYGTDGTGTYTYGYGTDTTYGYEGGNANTDTYGYGGYGDGNQG